MENSYADGVTMLPRRHSREVVPTAETMPTVGIDLPVLTACLLALPE
jgi:hypothetical protein